MKNPYMEEFSYTNIVRIANIVPEQGAKAPIKFAGTGKAWLLE